MWARNILGSEFDDWKRFRKIAAPAFSEVLLSADSIYAVYNAYLIEE
jgi:hypothetical protein